MVDVAPASPGRLTLPVGVDEIFGDGRRMPLFRDDRPGYEVDDYPSNSPGEDRQHGGQDADQVDIEANTVGDTRAHAGDDAPVLRAYQGLASAQVAHDSIIPHAQGSSNRAGAGSGNRASVQRRQRREWRQRRLPGRAPSGSRGEAAANGADRR